MPDGMGIINGDKDIREILKSVDGYYDMKALDISGHDGEDINLETELGTGVRVREIINTSGTAGNIIVKTYNDESDGYVTIPISATGSQSNLPYIKLIKKTGSVASVVCKYQKVKN
jgi:hypothetical protein